MKITRSVDSNESKDKIQPDKKVDLLPKSKRGEGQKVSKEEMDKLLRKLNSLITPEGILEVHEDEFTINLSDRQLRNAVDNANLFISHLDSSKVIGDDIKVAFRLVYEPKLFQNPTKSTFDDYFVKSLMKFLDPNFKLVGLFHR